AVYPAEFGGARAIDAPLINVFGTSGHDDRGFRTEKYRSNGTAVTVPRWREVIDIVSERPRVIRLRDGYLNKLAPLLLKGGGERPEAADAAVWFFRHRDVNGIGQMADLVARFAKEIALSQDEKAALFATTAENG